MYQIICGSQDIFNSTTIGELPVISAKMSEQLNESGNLQFVLAAGHPLYDQLEPMASYVTAYEDNEVIFEGRVLEAGLPTFSGQITYDCEGALSFLMDSEVPPIANATTMTVQAFFEWCLTHHNSEVMNDPRRTFQAGNVTVSDASKSEKFQITSYTQTKTAIENYLLNVYGGYLKIRYENGVRYLDWVENYSDQVDTGVIVIGENVVERSFTNSGENLFTVIRPVGKNGLTLDGVGTIDVFSSEEVMNKYGRIVRSVTFSDATTKADLQTKANEYIARLKKSLLCSGTIQIVEMHYLDGTSPKIKMGARFSNIEGLEGTVMTVSGRELDFMEPYRGDFSFGNDKSLSDGTPKGGGSISRATSRAGASAGMNYKHILELGDMVTINAETLNLQGETLNQHYEQINTTANQIITMSNDIDDMNTDLQTVMGSGVIQNDELLAHFAGTMRLRRNEQGIVTGIEFVDGTLVMDTDEEGHMVTVGAAIAANAGALQTIEGSALWTQRDNITGVCGEYDIVEDPVTHVKTIVVKSGGGMKIRRDDVEYGLYDEYTLTGGLIVEKINDDENQTLIKGNHVVIGDGQTAEVLTTALERIRSDVYNATSDIYTSIEQTASGIRTELVNAQESLAAYVEQTASYFRQTYANTNKTWVRDSDPTHGGATPKEGDIWIESTSQGTWDGAEGFDWEHDEDYDWSQIQGAKVWTWKNDKWELVSDQQQVVTMTDVEQTAEHIIQRALKAITNDEGNLSVYRAELLVEGDRIRGEVNELITQMGTSITQTAEEIRSEAHAAQSQVYSEILQSASSIVSRVINKPIVFMQWAKPVTTEDHPLVAGDIWIKTRNKHTWDDLFESDWEDESDFDWAQFKGDKIYVYNGDDWYLAVDGTVIAESVDVEETSSHWQAQARNLESLNGEVVANMAKLKVEATKISATVNQVQTQLGSAITQTAREIRSEVHAAQSSMYSVIEQTASHIRAEVSDAKNDLHSEILMTSCSISSAVWKASSQLYSRIEQTATSIRGEVNDARNDFHSEILMTSCSIRTSVWAASSKLYSAIEQTSCSIRLAVGNEITGLQSSIDIQADRIGLVVSGTGSNAKIKPASIVASINAATAQSNIVISADHINLDGCVKTNQFTASTVAAKIAQLTSRLNVGTTVLANDYYIRDGEDIASMKGAVKDINKSTSGNNITLTLAFFNGRTKDITFSRAVTSVSWSLSDGNLKVTPQPQNQEFTLGSLTSYRTFGHNAQATPANFELAANGYYIKDKNLGSGATVRIYTGADMTIGGKVLYSTSCDVDDYLETIPTKVYSDGFSAGKAAISSADITKYDLFTANAPSMPSGYERDNHGYYIINKGTDSAEVRIYTYAEITVNGKLLRTSSAGQSAERYDYLGVMPTYVYQDGFKAGYDADHSMFIGDSETADIGTSVNVSVGSPLEVWAYFKKKNNQYQWSSKYTFTAVDPHPHSVTLTRAMTGVNSSDMPVYYGKLFALIDGSYRAITSSNYYWYYTSTNIGAGKYYY